jgi:ATP-dependent exoDNAse (exonuclease V) beta subunit
LLQLIAEQGPTSPESGAGLGPLENWCRQQLRSVGVQGAKAERILQRSARAIDRCLASERGRWILSGHEEAASEYAVTAVIDGQVTSLKLDRTFVADGIRWIVDYKTSDHGGGRLEDFLESEKVRYATQLDRYRRALAINETRPIKTALYFPLLDEFLEVPPPESD